MSQNEKIVFSLETVTKGTKDILSTTSATERLTKSLQEQGDAVKSVQKQLSNVESYNRVNKSLDKSALRLNKAKANYQELGAQLEEQRKKTSDLNLEQRKAQREVNSLNKQLKNTSADGLNELNKKLATSEQRMKSVQDELIESRQKVDEFRAAHNGARKEVEKFENQQITHRRSLVSLKRNLREAGISTHNLGDEQKRLERQTDQSNASIAKQNARLKEMNSIQSRIDNRNAKLSVIGGQATSLAMAAAPLGGAAYMAMKNESSFADVSKVVNMSPEQASALKSWSRKQSTETPMSAEEINAMLAAGGRSGIQDFDELKSYVKDTAKMAVAFDMDAGDAGKTLATFKASMGLDQKGAMNLAGLANLLDNNMNATAADIADVMARQGATAQSGGFKINEAAALSASLLAAGLERERAATAVKNISGRLTMGSAGSKIQQNALAQIGFGADQLAFDMQRDASGSLIKVLDAIKAAPLEKQSALISQIFGEEVKGAVAALAGNTKNYTEALELANKGQQANADSINKEYQTKLATTENNVSRFTNKLANLSMVIGDSLLPALNWVLKPLGELVDWVTGLAEANKGLTSVLTLGTAAVIGIKGALLAGKAASLVFGNSVDKTRLFRKGLNRETKESGNIAAYTAKQWSRLNTVMSENLGRASRNGGSYGGKSSRRRSSRSRGIGGKLRSGLSRMRGSRGLKTGLMSLVGGGIAVAPMPSLAADAIDIGGDLAMNAGKVGLAKVLRPIGMAMNLVGIADAVQAGNMKDVGSNAGSLGGSMAGAAAGAAIGSVVPIIGTAIGGIIGSVVGGMGGEALGGWFGNKLDSPDVTAEKIAKVQAEKEERLKPVHFAPNITVNALPGQDAKAVAAEAINQMNDQYAYLTGGNTMTTQFSYAGIDRS
ncbi:phage tail tape measure protein [Vibrio sp. S17_S38]|uniref:phage tail tape measure protein n=1 Tax=Vibrio sp. S17_S38 TaxID=2720229 RepID=UPI0016814601|nr:phage tail tape measure protein [Vibrio sp. S17_S38]MBD1572877.1 phage tail tape measure protein [Vibrio sp. S17_S38]